MTDPPAAPTIAALHAAYAAGLDPARVIADTYRRIEVTVSRFPVLRVVQAELFRLRFLGRGNRILERNLSDRHALELTMNALAVSAAG